MKFVVVTSKNKTIWNEIGEFDKREDAEEFIKVLKFYFKNEYQHYEIRKITTLS